MFTLMSEHTEVRCRTQVY